MGVVIIPFDYEQLPDVSAEVDRSDLHRFRGPPRKPNRASLVRARSGSRPGPASRHRPVQARGRSARLGVGRDHGSQVVGAAWRGCGLLAMATRADTCHMGSARYGRGRVPVAHQAHRSPGAWLAGTRPLWKRPDRPDKATTKSMSESYWSNWSNAGSRRTIARRSVRFSRCCVRGTRGTKSPRGSMTRSQRR